MTHFVAKEQISLLLMQTAMMLVLKSTQRLRPIWCALIALARNENYSSFSSELLKLAKRIDERNKFSNADFDSALEHVKQIIPEL